MYDNFEKLIRHLYRKHKSKNPFLDGWHPDEEEFVCFLEGKLNPQESQRLKEHFLSCCDCIEKLASSMELSVQENLEVSPKLLEKIAQIIPQQANLPFLEICLKIKENFMELLNTTGDVLVGQEFMPAPILRSRQIKNFKDELIILKDFKELMIEIKIENKAEGKFDFSVLLKEKAGSQSLQDIRVTLLKDDLELESYVAQKGKVSFEQVSFGKYFVEISSVDRKIASIILDINR